MGASAGIFAFAPVVPSILGWAPEYQSTVPLMQVLVCFFPLLSMGMVYGAALVALGEERRLLVANVAATVVQYAMVFAAGARWRPVLAGVTARSGRRWRGSRPRW